MLSSVLTVFLMALVSCSARAASAEPGVADHEIVIGMSNALTGPALALGIGVKSGALTYFNRVSASGPKESYEIIW